MEQIRVIPENELPPGAIPKEEFDQGRVPAKNIPVVEEYNLPVGAIPKEEFDKQIQQQEHGSLVDQGITAAEQGLSGLTLGGSKIIETQGIPALGIPPITTPEAIKAREAANPVTATVSNIVGGVAPFVATGGLGALVEGAPMVARLGALALEGAGIGGINQITDDWSQNKEADAQKVFAASGLGAFLGVLGGAAFEGMAALKGKKMTPLAGNIESPSGILDQPMPGVRGVQGTQLSDIAERVGKAESAGVNLELPAAGELDSALSRIELENPVHPLQRDSLTSTVKSDLYKIAKESPNESGEILSKHEALQKRELVNKATSTIDEIAPGHTPIADAVKGGDHAIEAFTSQYQAEKEALKPLFKEIKTLPVQVEILPTAIVKMSDAVPGVANMIDASGSKITINPYRTSWGIDKATYTAVKQAVEALAEKESNSLESLWNVRKGLDQNIDVMAQGSAPAEIRRLKAALMDLMQEASGNPNIREAFKRYAINEQERGIIEKAFGASVGNTEMGLLSKVKPEMVGDKIFANTATVSAAKKILPKEKFQSILANWIAEAKAAATDKGTFSSNKFSSFLKRNQDALGVAFQDQPEKLQRLKDLTTIMRILPDAPFVNPSGTAKTLLEMGKGLLPQHFTWEGLVSAIPKKISEEIKVRMNMNKLNQALSGKAAKNATSQGIKMKAEKFTKDLDKGVAALFVGSSSQARKINERDKRRVH